MAILSRLLLLWLSLLALPAATAAGPATDASAAGRPVLVLEVDGIISPASSQFIRDGLDRAAGEQAELVVIELDTPGGLDTAMREIIKAILASPVPVATYVHPEGARAASAGTYILYASHIAAMSPATNLGAATPVSIGLAPQSPLPETPEADPQKRDPAQPQADRDRVDQDRPGDAGERPPAESKETPALGGNAMTHKTVNDATAYLRSLADLRGRNLDFARRAVREAASMPAEEALAAGVIDILAVDLDDLLARVDGRVVKLHKGERTLRTAHASVVRLLPDWRERLLAVLANPQLALVLMMIGIYGLFFEFTSPGFGVPGVAGAICLMLALYAFQMLPVNWAGVALLVLGSTLILAEAFMPSFGVLGVGGIVAFVLGGLFLVDSGMPALGIPLEFLAGMSLLSAAVIFAIGSFAARSRSRPLVSGSQTLAGRTGTVTVSGPDGAWAQVQGESWQVRSLVPLSPGDEVVVLAVDGLVLSVRPTSTNAAPPGR